MMADADLNNQNKLVTDDLHNLMRCFENLNVTGNVDMRLDVWCQIFSRLLEPDGKRLLQTQSETRFNIKQRAQDAFNYPEHPVAELSKKIMNFMEHIEYWGRDPDDFIEEQL